MRFLMAFILVTFTFSACSVNDIQPEEKKQDPAEDVSVNKPTPERISKEEELLGLLPDDVHSSDWNLLLVNPWIALPDNYETEMVEVDNEQRIDSRIKDAWEAWKQAAQDEGHRLFFASGYRTIERQKNNFNNSIQGYLNEGLSEEEALAKTKEYLTEPGHSEHHTGLALDIVDEEWINAGNGLDPEYDTQASQQWMVETMADFGFILRYPKGKEEITGIHYESWHFRFVGIENAQFIVEHELTLEEYIDLLEMRE